MSYCEIPEFYECSTPIARKQHKCCECSAPIMPGERYVYCVGKWSGDFGSYRQHWLCAEACEFIRDHLNDRECIGFGELQEFCYDINFDGENDNRIVRLKEMWESIKNRELLA